ncbi:shikimate dehydrogenase [Flindersiella endophytica]
MLNPQSRRCAVLGSPIAHSLSPVLHRSAYAALGLPEWRYDAFEVAEDGLAGFLAGLGEEWRGLSLTMPLKRVAIGLCDTVSELATLVGAVNTVVIDDERRVHGTNTDVPGVVAALRERGVEEIEAALLLGVGATACSALAGLAELGLRTATAIARDPSRAGELERLAAELDVKLTVVHLDSEWKRGCTADVAVSTVPDAAAAPVARDLAGMVDVVFDALYEPWPTRLGATAEGAGRVVVGGLDLLVHQAALQVELMTEHVPAPLAVMRAAGETALSERKSAAEA